MPISGVILIILGIVARPIILANATEEQLNRNVLLSAIPFILIFAAIVIFYMSLIWFLSIRLGGRVAQRIYRPIELGLIGGILLGVIFMFQPWVFVLFRVGFFVLLASTLSYILWSHIRPQGQVERGDVSGLSISEFEQRESGA
jgi:hypothetical protein